jgi:hypothetical protein
VPYADILADCQEFKDLVNTHKDTIGVWDFNDSIAPQRTKEMPNKGEWRHMVFMEQISIL